MLTVLATGKEQNARFVRHVLYCQIKKIYQIKKEKSCIAKFKSVVFSVRVCVCVCVCFLIFSLFASFFLSFFLSELWQPTLVSFFCGHLWFARPLFETIL